MRSTTKGFGLIEIVIAAAIIGMAIVSLSYVLVLSNRLNQRASNEIRANFITEEGIEAMRFLRDKGWTSNFGSLSTSADYYVVLDTTTGKWATTTANPGLLDGLFNRAIKVESVNRDESTDDIVLTGGTVDSNTLKIISTVTWRYGTTSIETYLSNVFKN